jgi:hypothetical protein
MRALLLRVNILAKTGYYRLFGLINDIHACCKKDDEEYASPDQTDQPPIEEFTYFRRIKMFHKEPPGISQV